MTGHLIARCTPHDGAHLSALRAEMLEQHPGLFDVDLVWWSSRSREWWDGFAAHCASSPTEAVFLAHAPGIASPVGMAHVRVDPDRTGHLGMLYVTPPHRRLRLAAALLDARTTWARAAGCRTLRCTIADGNEASDRLHQEAGWTRDPSSVSSRSGGTEWVWTLALPAPGSTRDPRPAGPGRF